jgi:hypothetical protein
MSLVHLVEAVPKVVLIGVATVIKDIASESLMLPPVVSHTGVLGQEHVAHWQFIHKGDYDW